MLEFDAYQRSETVKRILSRLLPKPGRLLDVGGYPGRMRALMPEHYWFICDPLVDASGDHIIGSASQLPFADQCFEFAVALDVLEHIPQGLRETSLNEMFRVSEKGIILTFPHREPYVEQAERIICEQFESAHSGQKHPWLSEHLDNTLPDAREIEAALRGLSPCLQIFSLGSIERWARLQRLGIWLEAYPMHQELGREIDRIYQDELFSCDFVEPCYRKAMLLTREEIAPIEFGAPNPAQERLAELEIECLASKIMRPPQPQDGPAETETITQDYVHRLEKGLQFWEETYTQVSDELIESLKWRDRLEHQKGFRAYKKLMRLLGKQIDS